LRVSLAFRSLARSLCSRPVNWRGSSSTCQVWRFNEGGQACEQANSRMAPLPIQAQACSKRNEGNFHYRKQSLRLPSARTIGLQSNDQQRLLCHAGFLLGDAAQCGLGQRFNPGHHFPMRSGRMLVSGPWAIRAIARTQPRRRRGTAKHRYATTRYWSFPLMGCGVAAGRRKLSWSPGPENSCPRCQPSLLIGATMRRR